MYAVFFKTTMIYLGKSLKKAMAIIEKNNKNNSCTLKKVATF